MGDRHTIIILQGPAGVNPTYTYTLHTHAVITGDKLTAFLTFEARPMLASRGVTVPVPVRTQRPIDRMRCVSLYLLPRVLTVCKYRDSVASEGSS